MPTPALWNVPYPRNPYFTGREDVLAALHRTLHTDNIVALSHPQGISGLGGIGKTQTALEYAYRYRRNYSAVLWVRADTGTALISSMVELARLLELPERDEQDQEIIVQAVLRWLRLHPDWLLIYDNMDDLSIAEPFLPKAGPGHLLFTTRSRAFGAIAQRLDIEKMEPDIGALLLLRRASLLALQASLDMAHSDDQNVARAITEELGGLPLALDQAGAYIKEAPCPLSDYLTRYRTRRSDLLGARGSVDQHYPASVATTWSLSFERVSSADPAAADLLDFCAFIAPDAIPEEMIVTGAPYLTPPLQMAINHPLQFDQVIAVLLTYSLVGRNADATLRVHRLVQTVIRDAMDEMTGKQWAQRAVRSVNAVFPGVEFATWSQCERYLPHALVCAELVGQEQGDLPEAANLLYNAGCYLLERTRSAGDASSLLRLVLTLIEHHLGPEHTHTASVVDKLARCFEVEGKYRDAEPLYKRALSIREHQLGNSHPETGDSLNNLGNLVYAQGRHGEAKCLFMRALGVYEQCLGEDDLRVARCRNNLALLDLSQGKYKQVEPELVQVLALKERQLGDDHPSTVLSLNNLASLYQAQGKYTEAELAYRRVLMIDEKIYGDKHPDIASDLNNLGELYRLQGKREQAEPLLVRALAIREEQLGVDHPDTATSLNNLALIYEACGKYTKAESLFRRSLAIREEQLGADHPDMATSLNNLALIYEACGKYTEAESLFRRSLAIREEQLGADHPDTATSLNNLALLYKLQEKYSEAEPLLARALAIREEKLGADHPDTATSLNSLALIYEIQRKYGEAETLFQRALTIRETQLSSEHASTAQSFSNLAGLYWSQGKNAEAELLFRRALVIRERILGPEHLDVANSLSWLACVYWQWQQYDKAVPLYRRALSILKQTLGETHPITKNIQGQYVALVQAIGCNIEATFLEVQGHLHDGSN